MTTGALPPERYESLENAIYEAAIVPEQWPTVLESINEIGGGFGAVLFSVADWGAQWTSSARLQDAMREFLEDGWITRNSRMATGIELGLHLEPRFVTEIDYFGTGELPNDPLHTDFFGPHGLGPSAGTIALLPHGDMFCFSVERRVTDGTIGAEALAQLDSLRPHLARSAMMTARLGLERVRTAVDTLNQLGFAAAAVDRVGAVIVANAGFELASMPWTTLTRDRLALHDQSADRLLREALDGIDGVSGVRSVPLRDDDQIVRHVLHIVPVRRLAHDLFSRAHAIVMITSSVDRDKSPSLLQALFDLTPAEAALARAIGAGQSVEDIAIAQRRSIFTLRNQLRSVLSKTGCTRQAELTRMLATLVPPAL